MIMPAHNRLKSNYELIVIGGGPAGLAAALEAGRNGLEDILIIERQPELGGILTQCIHNGFGSVLFKKDMPGPLYANEFIRQMGDGKIHVVLDTMVVDVTRDRRVYITGRETGYTELSAETIVLAMGCRERTRAQIKLPGCRPAGVFTAGTVQRLVNIEGFMPGKEVVILGSGDIGMIMARRLTLEGARVRAVLELLPFLTGLRRNYVQCLQDFGIPLHLSTTVKKIIGNHRVKAIETVQVDDHAQPVLGSERRIDCDTLILSVGLIPENELSAKLGVELDPLTLGPRVDEHMATSAPGVFAAGNVVTIYDLVDFVSQAGFVAGASAAAFVRQNKPSSSNGHLSLRAGCNIRSLTPQTLSGGENNKKVQVYFRVSQPVDGAVSIELKNDRGIVVKSFRKRYARPAEMMSINITTDEIITDRSGSLSLNVSKIGAEKKNSFQMQKMICIRCPMGCEMDVSMVDNRIKVTGNVCKLGRQYAEDELTRPSRIVTSTVRVKDGEHPLVPVWTNGPVPKNRIPEIMEVLRSVEIEAPVDVHQVVVKDILGLGVDVETSGTIESRLNVMQGIYL